MHRVLKANAQARVFDLRPDVSLSVLHGHAREMKTGWMGTLWTTLVLHWLTKRAHSEQAFRQMVAKTPFASLEIGKTDIGLGVTLRKGDAPGPATCETP